MISTEEPATPEQNEKKAQLDKKIFSFFSNLRDGLTFGNSDYLRTSITEFKSFSPRELENIPANIKEIYSANLGLDELSFCQKIIKCIKLADIPDLTTASSNSNSKARCRKTLFFS